LFEGAGTGAGEKTLEDKFFEHEVIIIIDKIVIVNFSYKVGLICTLTDRAFKINNTNDGFKKDANDIKTDYSST